MTTTPIRQQGPAESGRIRLIERQIEDALLQHDRVTDCAVIFQGADVDEVPAERCTDCGMDAAYPGTVLDADGVCNLCLMYREHREQMHAFFPQPERFLELVRERAEAAGSQYDCLLLFSGGKDSTYVLHQLVRLGLKVMTFTFDNGFISRTALENVETVTRALGIEHLTLTRADQDKVFVDSLRVHQSVCNGCFRSLLDLANQLAHERGIPSIVTGLSRGQIIDERLLWFYRRGEFDPEAIEQQLRVGRQVYHKVGSRLSDGVLDQVEVIDYYRYSAVTKDDIRAFLNSSESLWEQPKDTGFCSSNCMINDVGVYVHKLERGFHNYESPTRWEVRLGHLDRAEADEELRTPVNIPRVRSMLARIGYGDPGDRSRLGRRMAAYYVAGEPLAEAELRSAVAERLPELLLPEHWIQVPQIPRRSGAVQRRELPDPQAEAEAVAEPSAARSASEAVAVRPEPGQLRLLRDTTDTAAPQFARAARTLLLDLPGRPDLAGVRRAVLRLLQERTELRLRFERTADGEWLGHVAGLSGPVPVSRLDLSGQDPAREPRLLVRAAERLSGQLTPAQGRLLTAALVESADRDSRLLLVLHRLAADAGADALPGLLHGLAGALEQSGTGPVAVASWLAAAAQAGTLQAESVQADTETGATV